MTTYYVDKDTGSNGDSGLTLGAAWATYAYATSGASPVGPGDRIELVKASTPYTESFNYGKSGTFANRITVASHDPDDPTIISPSSTIQIQEDYWTHENLIISDCPNTPYRLGAAGVTANHIKFDTCVFKHNADTGLAARNTNNLTIYDCLFYDNRTRIVGDGCMDIYSNIRFTNVDILRTRFYDHGADGIQIQAISGGCSGTIVDCVFGIFRPYGSRNWHDVSTNVGENGLDWKNVSGPLTIRRCVFFGYRSCVASQDASGCNGTGFVTHNNSRLITFEQCRVYDCHQAWSVSAGGAGYPDNEDIVLENCIGHNFNASDAVVGATYTAVNGLSKRHCTIHGAQDLYLNIGPDVVIDQLENCLITAGDGAADGTYDRNTPITGESNVKKNAWHNLAGGPPSQWNNTPVTITNLDLDDNLAPESTSDVLNAGNNLGVARDLAGNVRDSTPALGAFEQMPSLPTNANLLYCDGRSLFIDGYFQEKVDANGELTICPIENISNTFGLAVKIDNTTAHTMRSVFSSATHIRFATYIKLHWFQMTSGNSFSFIVARNTVNDRVADVTLRYDGTDFFVAAGTVNDAGTNQWAGSSSGFAIDRSDHLIEVELQAASSPGANDGVCKLWIDGVLQGSNTSIDNDTVDFIRVHWGAPADIDAGTGDSDEELGTFYLYGMRLNNNGLTIGALSGELPGASPSASLSPSSSVSPSPSRSLSPSSSLSPSPSASLSPSASQSPSSSNSPSASPAAGLAFTNLGDGCTNPSINSSTDATSYSNSSWTPPTTGLIVVAVGSRRSGGAGDIATISGNSLTWTRIITFSVGANATLQLFGAIATGATTGATTVDFGAATQTCCTVHFCQVTGIDLSGGVAAAFVQTPTNTASSGTTASVTLAAAANSNNRPYAAVLHLTNEVTNPRTNWTELNDCSGATDGRGLETQYRGDTFETTASGTFATSDRWGIIAVEFKASAGSASSSPSRSQSPSASASRSVSPSASPSVSPSVSPSLSPSASPSASFSPSASPSPSPEPQPIVSVVLPSTVLFPQGSLYQPLNITISVSDPLWFSSRRSLIQILESPSSYNQTISNEIGYDSNQIQIVLPIQEIEDWLINGLGRHITIYNPFTDIIWEGFVNSISVNEGRLSIQRGPMLEIVNRGDAVYSVLDTSVSPPAVGNQTSVGVVNDTDSQTLYGILYKKLNSGTVTATEAAQILDTYLKENKLAQTNPDLSLGRDLGLSLTIDCLGYGHLLNNYYYSSSSTGTQNASAKLTAVLAAQPNSIFSTDYGDVTTNTLQVHVYEDGNNTAQGVIKDIVSRGDTSDNRYTFGIFANRKARYRAMPTTIKYLQTLSDPTGNVYTYDQQLVYPWDVLPGEWLLLTDFLPNIGRPPTLRDDLRLVFIERVSFSIPYDLQISGGKVGTLNQKLAKMGLGGL